MGSSPAPTTNLIERTEMIQYYKIEKGWIAVLEDESGNILKKSKVCRDRKEAQKEARKMQ